MWLVTLLHHDCLLGDENAHLGCPKWEASFFFSQPFSPSLFCTENWTLYVHYQSFRATASSTWTYDSGQRGSMLTRLSLLSKLHISHRHASFVFLHSEMSFLLSLSFDFWVIPPFQEHPIWLKYALLPPLVSSLDDGTWFIFSKHSLLQKVQGHCHGWRLSSQNRMQSWAQRPGLGVREGARSSPLKHPDYFKDF